MSSFCKYKSYSHFFSKNISIFAIFNDQSFNDTLTNDIVSFEQLGPGVDFMIGLFNDAYLTFFLIFFWGWLGEAKVSCILRHWGVHLLFAYSWARPAVLEAGKGRGGMFLFLLFLHFHSFSAFSHVPLFHLLYCLFYLSSPFLWEMKQNYPQGLTCR